MHDSSYHVPNAEVRDRLRHELAIIFLKNGSSVLDYSLALKSAYNNVVLCEDMIVEALDVDYMSLFVKVRSMQKQLNCDHLHSYNCIIDRLRGGAPELFFLSGYGGTGKIFLWNALSAYLRGCKRFVLAIASSGVPTLLLPMGRTTF